MEMMEGHIYKAFDMELKELKEKLLHEAGLVERAIQDAIKALLERTSDVARKVIEDDDSIKTLEVEIDEILPQTTCPSAACGEGFAIHHNSH